MSTYGTEATLTKILRSRPGSFWRRGFVKHFEPHLQDAAFRKVLEAHLNEKDIYGFNGKHLGWFEDGKIYDHSGRIVGTTAEAAIVALTRPNLQRHLSI